MFSRLVAGLPQWNTHGSSPFLVAVKNLSLSEEYLSDHFPGFPVMPGVLMLEALTQAGGWLIRELEDFAHSIIILKQAKTIKYHSFVEPGRQLELRVELIAHDPRDCVFKGVGVIDGQEMVKGRFTLTRYNLREKDPELARDRRLDRRWPSRSVLDVAKGLCRRQGDHASSRGVGSAYACIGELHRRSPSHHSVSGRSSPAAATSTGGRRRNDRTA